MKRNPLLQLLLLLLLFCAPFLPTLQAQAPPLQADESSNDALITQLRQQTDNIVQISYHRETEVVRFIGTTLDHAIPQPTALPATASSEEAALAFLKRYGGLFGLPQPPTQALRLKRTQSLADGRSFVRFQQVYEELPVIGGELLVQLNENNEILSVNGEILPDLTLDTTPAIDPDLARQLAIERVAKDAGVEIADLVASDATLSLYNPILLGGSGPRFEALVWQVYVTPRKLAPVNGFVLVDAKLGVIALHFNLGVNVKTRIVYDNNNNSTLGLPGVDLVRREKDEATGIADIDLAYAYMGDTYDFFFNEHGRDSLDDAGMELLSTVRYCPDNSHCPYQNAFWDGQQIVFGEGHTAADDIVAHELTHGVTQFSSNLFYYQQAGAINESFSDLWGEFVDLSNNNEGNQGNQGNQADDESDVRWLIGEDLPHGGAVRDMREPTRFLQPDRMGSDLYWCEEIDNGGVHINSGVNNKAVSLMTDGGTFNGYTIEGMGLSKTADLYYEVQNNLLLSAADYADLYDLLQQAALNLGYSPTEQQLIKDALDAVEMNQSPKTCVVPPAPLCAADEATDLFFDDFEAGSQRWQGTSAIGEDAWFVPQDTTDYLAHPYTVSGQKSLWGYYQFEASDTSIAMKEDIQLPDVAFMHFHHAFGFEFDSDKSIYYDGGVVEYSTDGGQRWQDAKSLFTHNGYNSKLVGQNPLGLRAAFVGNSPGYISSRLNLSSLAGQAVRFRFRLGIDDFGEDYGWFIDDVRLYTCKQPEADLALKSSARQAVAANDFLTYTLSITNEGPYDATDIVLSDTLPAESTFHSASEATCEAQEGLVTCKLPFIEREKSKIVTLVVTTPPKGGDIRNEATVRAAEADLYQSNNHDTISTQVNPTDLFLTRNSQPSVILAQPFRYILTVKNDGAFAVPNVLLTDTIPSNMSLESVDTRQGTCQSSENEDLMGCDLGTIESQASVDVVVVLNAPLERQVISQTAHVTSDSLDLDPSNNSNKALILVTNPSATRYVAPDGKNEGDCANQPTPCQSITYAADQAAFGDTLYLAAGNYPESVILDKSLIIQGKEREETILEGEQAGSPLQIGKGVDVTLNDLTITNGRGTICTGDERACGGGIYNNGTLTVNRVDFTHNRADWAGGAIYNNHELTVNQSRFSHNDATSAGSIYNLGHLTVNESEFSENKAARGGAIYNWEAEATLSGSTFRDNEAAYGGGIYNLGVLKIEESKFHKNRTTWGGGLYNSGGEVTIERSLFRENEATGHPYSFGGGLYNSGGTLLVRESTIMSNTTTNSGGGINSFFGKLIVDKSTISDNHVTELDGGAINGNGVVQVINSTLSGNRASNEGGAIWFYEGTLTLNQVTISNNYAPNGGHALSITDTLVVNLKNTLIDNHFDGANCLAEQDKEQDKEEHQATLISSLGYNLSNDNSCYLTHETDQPNRHAGVMSLADYGGETFTHALLPTSPAIEAGDCTSERSDQRGIVRQPLCDIGASEILDRDVLRFHSVWQRISFLFGVK